MNVQKLDKEETLKNTIEKTIYKVLRKSHKAI